MLDGLERVLVAYHRYDAAQVVDEEAATPDFATRRDPCAAIRPSDDDLLRHLCGATPSKILITSRLVPRAVLNSARQPLPGVAYQRLGGLTPADAETLLRRCGVVGRSLTMQAYLQRHCDCHPLVTGVIAGLVNEYLPARGTFDAWAADPNYGGKLDVGELNLIQKRNHILRSALAAVSGPSKQLLSSLALLFESADFKTLRALNPNGPPEPNFVAEPTGPRQIRGWSSKPLAEQLEYEREYSEALSRRAAYLREYEVWGQSAGVVEAQRGLREAVFELERRGLLQYDQLAERYDLHPVVRAVVAGDVQGRDQEVLGQRVVDYFSAQLHDPFQSAANLHDLHVGLTVVRTLLRLGRTTSACAVYRGGLGQALHYNLEAFAEMLSTLRPFFDHGWTAPDPDLALRDQVYLATEAAIALHGLRELDYSISALTFSLDTDLSRSSWSGLSVDLCNLSAAFEAQNRLAHSARCASLAVESAVALGTSEDIFRARMLHFEGLVLQGGKRDEIDRAWANLRRMGQGWSRNRYRPGDLEVIRAEYLFDRGLLTESFLASAEKLARGGRNRKVVRLLATLRGIWRLEGGEVDAAIDSLAEAVRIGREAGLRDSEAECWLALAKAHTEDRLTMLPEAERLADSGEAAHLPLARLWHALGGAEQARKHALAAYEYAWADGTPYVRAHQLRRARKTLESIGTDVPNYPPYDSTSDRPFPWERAVHGAVERLGRASSVLGYPGPR